MDIKSSWKEKGYVDEPVPAGIDLRTEFRIYVLIGVLSFYRVLFRLKSVTIQIHIRSFQPAIPIIKGQRSDIDG